MTYTITRNSTPIATYHVKRTDTAAKGLRAIRAFYRSLYPQDNIQLHKEA